jgi:cell wall-associated NlpC family hydrolase
VSAMGAGPATASTVAARLRSGMTVPSGIHLRPLLAIVAVLALALVAAIAPGTAGADRLADAQAEADAVEAELGSINAQVAVAAEAYNAAQAELDQTEAAIAENQRLLAASKQNLKVSRTELSALLVDAYRRGDPDVIAFLLTADSIDALVDQTRFMQRVTSHAGNVVRDVRRYTREVREREAALEQERIDRQAALDQRAAEEAAVRGLLAEREALLDSLNGEIAGILAAREAARRAEAQTLAQGAEGVLEGAAAQVGDGVDVGGSVGGGDYADASISAPPSSSVGSAAASMALSQLGVPYLWAGSTPATGFDCSGLILWAYAQVGVSLPRTAAEQFASGVPVPLDALEPGDIVSFRGSGHAGIYIGGGQYVHSPQTGDVVKVSNVFDRSDIDGAVRVA